MQVLTVDHAEVILRDFEHGQGKIIIAGGSDCSYSFYWGSMGSSLKEFLLSLDGGYFATKLCPARDFTVFCGKSTARNLRKEVKETMAWYEHMEFQKSVREVIREVESMQSEEQFFNWQNRYMDEMDFWKIDCRYDRNSLESEFKELFGYHSLETRRSDQYQWLERFLPKLKKALA
jgi:hypothetical protein